MWFVEQFSTGVERSNYREFVEPDLNCCRYLLPFEMYLHGRDYTEYVQYLRSADDKLSADVLASLLNERKRKSHSPSQFRFRSATTAASYAFLCK